MIASELILNPPIPHGANQTQGTAAASYSATSAASYSPTGSGSSVVSLAITARCVRHVTVGNLATNSANVYVQVGTTTDIPPGAGSNGSGLAIPAGVSRTFRVPAGGTIGSQGLVSCAASAEGAILNIAWHQ